MGRRLLLAAVISVGAASAGRAADWQVHRGGSEALLERAKQALRDRPDNAALARRIAALAGKRGATALRTEFGARATGAGYGPVAAYAQILLAIGDARAAAAAFADALRLVPDSVASSAGRARALAAAGQVSDALAAFDEARAREHRPRALRQLVEDELALASAQPPAESATNEKPAGEPAGERAAPERVLALRRALVELEPNDDAAVIALADALEAAGRSAEAAEAVEKRLPRDRPTAKLDWRLRAARLRLAGHDPAAAARVAADLEKLIAALPAGARADRRAAWTCAREVARARGTLDALAVELGRKPGPVEWDLLGQVRDELGDLDGARIATRAALERAPRDADLGRRLISILDRLGRADEARAVADELGARLPADVSLAAELVERRFRDGQRDAAGAALDRALARFAGQPTALARLGELAGRWGDRTRALVAWRRLRRLDPKNEIAIVGLGEAELEAGRRDDARRTWSALRARAGGEAAGHLRLAEVLFDHDLFVDAVEEARLAERLEPREVELHRLLARISERQLAFEAAIAEWNRVLLLAGTPGAGNGRVLRREARTHVLALAARQGQIRLRAEVQRLEGEAAAYPDDTELALALAEAEQRAGDTAGAMATLRAIASAAATGLDARGRDDAVEAGLELARLLKRSGRLDQAAAELDAIGRLAPERARQTALQVADLALGRYDVPTALERAAEAKTGADGATLERIGELGERAGDDALAMSAYQEATGAGGPPAAAIALSRIHERRGEAAAAATAIESLLRTTRDEEVVTEGARQALDLEEALGRLPRLVEALGVPAGAGAEAGGVENAARPRALVEALERWLPALYRDSTADGARARLAAEVLRPLLDLVTDPGAEPDPRPVELIGLLGDRDATPVLARLAAPGPEARTGRRPSDAAARTRLAAVVALGRLGDPRGRAALEEAATNGGPGLRAPSLWGLGRLAETPTARLSAALADRNDQIQAIACLGLGRHPDGATVAALAQVAADPARAGAVRTAAIAALGRAGHPEATPALVRLVDSGDEGLARAAALALGRGRDPTALPALLERALLPEAHALPDASAPLAALGVWLAGGAEPDEARGLTSDELDTGELLSAFTEAEAPVDLTPLVRARSNEIEALLARALDGPIEARRAALFALDSRPDGPGLGALAPVGTEPISAELAASLREMARPLADKLAARLDDPDPPTRGAALDVLAKLDDDRVTPARLAAAVEDDRLPPDTAWRAAQALARARPDLAPAVATALRGALGEAGTPFSWRHRLAAVRVLAAFGPTDRAPLERATHDVHPVVRRAALDALADPPVSKGRP